VVGRLEQTGIEAVAAMVGDRWTMLVLRDVFRGVRRFGELCADLGIARPVLVSRLNRLVEAGILEKVPYQSNPPRFDYRLTPMGVELSPALIALIRWGDRWFGDGEPTAHLVHAPCGHDFEQAFWCPTCRTTFGPDAIKSRRTTRLADT
jgi:DNA-binding HxlR family transcriptional regulator